MIPGAGPQFVMHGMSEESDGEPQRIKKGIVKRILPYTRPYRRRIGFLVLVTVVEAAITAANPLLLRVVIDDGILPRRTAFVVGVAIAMACLALLELVSQFTQSVLSGRIGEGMVYDL